MIIFPSAEIRLNYNSVVKECRETGEPIYLTKNGQGELVVMDIESFEKREQTLKAQQLVLEAYAERLAGAPLRETKEVEALMQSFVGGKQ